MSAEFTSIANTLAELLQQVREQSRTSAGASCFYFEPESAEWRDAVFHKWCENPASPQAIVHDQLTGVCLLIRMAELRYKKAPT